jgi:hypothetical protein
VTATDHAGEEAGKVLGPLIDGLDDVAGRFSEREQQVIVRYLEAAAESLRAYEPPP